MPRLANILWALESSLAFRLVLNISMTLVVEYQYRVQIFASNQTSIFSFVARQNLLNLSLQNKALSHIGDSFVLSHICVEKLKRTSGYGSQT